MSIEMSVDAIELFEASFSSFYNHSDLSDVTVKCGEHTIRAHKVVLAAHSPVFRKMFTGDWKEAKEGILKIDEPPAVVEAMIYYMYHFRYNTEGLMVAKRDTPLVFEARIYAIAEMYGINALKKYAQSNFSRIVNVTNGMYLRVFAPLSWDLEDFINAISVIYSSTVDEDRGLRAIVTEVASHENEKLVVKPSFLDLLRDSEIGFAGDYALVLAQKLTAVRKLASGDATRKSIFTLNQSSTSTARPTNPSTTTQTSSGLFGSGGGSSRPTTTSGLFGSGSGSSGPTTTSSGLFGRGSGSSGPATTSGGFGGLGFGNTTTPRASGSGPSSTT